MRIYKGFAVLAGAVALSVGAAVPASAEFFSCHDKPGQLLYSYNGTPASYGRHTPRRYSRNGYRAYGSASHARYYRAGALRATYFRSQRYWNGR
jgi:hypothetical protein